MALEIKSTTQINSRHWRVPIIFGFVRSGTKTREKNSIWSKIHKPQLRSNLRVNPLKNETFYTKCTKYEGQSGVFEGFFFWFIKSKSYFFCFCCVFRRNNCNGLADSFFVYFFSIFCCVPLLQIFKTENHNVSFVQDNTSWTGK